MWRIARLAIVAAMLIAAAYGAVGGTRRSVSPHVVTLARIAGRALNGTAAKPASRLVIAYDAAAARELWMSTHAGRGTRRAGPARGYGVYADLRSVDFVRQAVVILESAAPTSCPTSVVDVRPLAAGAIDVVTTTYRSDEFCTADLHVFTEIAAVDRDLLPDATALHSAQLLLGGTRIGTVHVATAS
jgi:hypothetical protein